ncbi:hypothetical protein LINPERHAP2_LOCUS15897, partial [Linum perenne]
LDVEDCVATISCLNLGRTHFPILLRLLHIWQPDVDVSSDTSPPLYTLWLDLEECMIEGRTDARHAQFVWSNFVVNTIYKFPYVEIIHGRVAHTSATNLYRLLIRRSQQFEAIYEDPTVPFFPTIGLSALSLATLRENAFSSEYRDPDICGRMLSIANFVHTQNVRKKFTTILLDESRCEVQIEYDGNYLPEFSLAHLANAEQCAPVICCFSSMNVIRPQLANERLVATNTKATRVFLGQYNHRFRHIMDCFFHDHLPIRFHPQMHDQYLQFVRSPLPEGKRILGLLAAAADNDLLYNKHYWTMAKVIHVYRDRQLYVHDDDAVRYQIPIRCVDATESINFVLDDAAATAILKTPVLQYMRMSVEQRFTLLDSIMYKCFTFEVKFLSPGHIYP